MAERHVAGEVADRSPSDPQAARTASEPLGLA